MPSPAKTSNSTSQLLLRLLPWLVSLGCIAYILATTDFPTIWAALKNANMLLFWGSVFAIFVPFVFPIDAFSVSRAVSWFNAPISFRELLPIRGAAYLLGIFNYNAATAGMSLYLKRTRGIPALETLGSLLFMTLCDVSNLAVLILLGAGLLEDGAAASSRIAGLGILAILAGTLMYWRGGIDFFILGRLRNRSIFSAVRRARIVQYGAMMLLRMPITVLYVALQYYTLQAFDIHIPFMHLMVYVPIQMLVAGLPISIAGIGTVQVAQRVLYAPYAEIAVIDAFAVCLVVAFLAPRAVIGMAFVAKASRDLGRGVDEPGDGEEPESNEPLDEDET